MFQLKVTIHDLELKRKFERAIKHFSSFKPEMEKVGDWLLDDAKVRLEARKSKWPSGRLIKSLKRRAYKLAVTIYSHLPYARIQQEGGVVRSKRSGGMLAIPLREKEGRAHTWPKHWAKDRLFPIKTRKGKLFLAVRQADYNETVSKTGRKRRKKTGTTHLELVYLLLESVRIKGRPYLVKSPELIRYMRTLVVEKWERWKRGAA